MGYCLQLIKGNEVIKFLSQQGYAIANFSVFDLAGSPSPVDQDLLPVKTRLITSNTFFSRVYRDMGWMVTGTGLVSNHFFYKTAENNQALLAMTKAFSAVKNKQPGFVYAHFYLPHAPFFFDKAGHLRDKKNIAGDAIGPNQDVRAYLEYVQYANTQIEQLVNTIQFNTAGKAVIILMGDHGFRENIGSNMRQNYQCLNAVYFPGKDYSRLYDSISSVNQFRVVFNTMFNQSLPLLKDSAVFLKSLHSSVDKD
jgi:hypothetical protein